MTPGKGKAPTLAGDEASVKTTPDIKQKELSMSNSTEIQVSSAITLATPELITMDGKVTTTSLQVAQHFGKRHDTVLRAIRNLECSAEYHARNFAEMVVETKIGSGAVRKDPAYRITRDGFVFLAMGFTGKEAAQWKEAYITAFNQMESELLGKEMQHLRESTTKALPNGLAPAQQRCLQEAVAKKAMALPKARQRAAYPALWGGIKSHFQVGTYKDLSESQLDAALSFVKSYEWEIVDEEPAVKKYHFPLESADPHDRQFGNAWMSPRALTDPNNRAPELELIAQLEKDGHDVMGVKIRILAMREGMEQVEQIKQDMRRVKERLGPVMEIINIGLVERGKNVQFAGKPNPNNAIDRHVFQDQMGLAS